MVRFSLQEVFLVQYFTDTNWTDLRPISYYLEVIFVEKGNGTHSLNGAKAPYTKKDVLVITQKDQHHFEAKEESTFCVYQFTDLLFSSRVQLSDRLYWLRRIEFILRHSNLRPGHVIKDLEEQQLIWKIHALIKDEYERQQEYFRNIIANMVSTSLSIIARNINKNECSSETEEADGAVLIDDIKAYIHKHAYDPAKMKITSLAKTFKMTNNALSVYFKKSTGESIHHYVLLYKLDLVKYRLEHTEFTVSQIAFQLGFTDESHLTRIFKKYHNSTPKQFRQSAT